MITLEYILIKDKNDSLQQADKLSKIALGLKAKVNLIIYNKVSAFSFEPSLQKNVNLFLKCLADKGVKVTLRESKGEDIEAACGQLAGCGKII